MRSVWASLAWKEWHEHKWKLASIVAILWGVTSLALLIADQDMFGLALGLLFLSIVPLAVFVGLGAAANERSSGTMLFLQSLPVPMWRVALSKLLFGLLTIIVPIVLTVGLFYSWTLGLDALGVEYRDALRSVAKGSPLSDTGNWYLDAVIFCAPIAASLFIWSAAAGVNRKDEISAAAVALAVMAGWCLLLMLIYYLLFLRTETARSDDGKTWLAVIGMSTAPGGIGAANDVSDGRGDYLMLSVFTAVITHLALAMWYIRRFGRVANLEIRSPQFAVRNSVRSDWLAPPRRSSVSAVAWKQFRESSPLVLAGLAGVVGVVTALYAVAGRPPEFGKHLAGLYAAVSTFFGFAVVLVVGIGVCLYDMGPKLNTFWRSRPINPDLWFWTKFVSGLVVVLAAIYIPIVFIAAIGSPSGLSGIGDPETRFIFPTMHLAIFAAAVATTCLVRHAVYAAILSIALIYLGMLAGSLACLAAGLLGWMELQRAWWEPTGTQMATGLVTSFVSSTLIAWLAVRYDWGYKSRY